MFQESSPEPSRPPSRPVSARHSRDRMTPKGPRTPATSEKPLPSEPQTPTPIREINIVRRHRSQDLQDRVPPHVDAEELTRKPSRSKLSKRKSTSSIKRRGSGKSKANKTSNLHQQAETASKPFARQRPSLPSGHRNVGNEKISSTRQGGQTAEEAIVPEDISQPSDPRKMSFSERTRSLTKRISLSDFSKGRSAVKGTSRGNQSAEPAKYAMNHSHTKGTRQLEPDGVREVNKVGRSRTKTLTNKTRLLGRRISRGDLLSRKRVTDERQPSATDPAVDTKTDPTTRITEFVNQTTPHEQASMTAENPSSQSKGSTSSPRIGTSELSGDSTFIRPPEQEKLAQKLTSDNGASSEGIRMVPEKEQKSSIEATPLAAETNAIYAGRLREDSKQRSNVYSNLNGPRHELETTPTRPSTGHHPLQTSTKLRKRSLDSDAARPRSSKSQKTFPFGSDERRPSLTRKVQKVIWGNRSSDSDRAMSMPSTLKPIGEKPPRIPTPEPSALLGQSMNEVLEGWKKRDDAAGVESRKHQNLQPPSNADADGQRPHSARSASYTLFPTDTNRSVSPKPSRPESTENTPALTPEAPKLDLDRPLLPERNPTFTSHPPNLALGTPPSLSKTTDLSDMPVMQASPARTPLAQDPQQHKSMLLEIDTATLATRTSTHASSTPVADTDVPSLPSSLPPSAHPGKDGPGQSDQLEEHVEVSRPTSSAFDNTELPLGTRNEADGPLDPTADPTADPQAAPQMIPEDKASNLESKQQMAAEKAEEDSTIATQQLSRADSEKLQDTGKTADAEEPPSHERADEEQRQVSDSRDVTVEAFPKDVAKRKSGPTHLAEAVLTRARPRFPDRYFQRRSFPAAGSWADATFGRLKPVEEEADHNELLGRVQSASQANVIQNGRERAARNNVRRRPVSASYAQGPLFNASKERVDQIMLPKSRPVSMYAAPNPASIATELKQRPLSTSTIIRIGNDGEIKNISSLSASARTPPNVDEDAEAAAHPVEEALQRLLAAHEGENQSSRPVSNSSAAEALKTLTGEADSSGAETADEAYKRLTLDTSTSPSGGNAPKLWIPSSDVKEKRNEAELSRGEPNISRRRSPIKKRHSMSGAVPPTADFEDKTPISAFYSPVSAYPSPTTNRIHHLTSPISFPPSGTASSIPYHSSATQTSPASAGVKANASNRHSWAGSPTNPTAMDAAAAAFTGSFATELVRKPSRPDDTSIRSSKTPHRHSSVDPRSSTTLENLGLSPDLDSGVEFLADPNELAASFNNSNSAASDQAVAATATASHHRHHPSASSSASASGAAKPRLSLDTSNPSHPPSSFRPPHSYPQPYRRRSQSHSAVVATTKATVLPPPGPGIPRIVAPPPPNPKESSASSSASKHRHARSSSERSLEKAQAKAQNDAHVRRMSLGTGKGKEKRHIGDAAYERKSLEESRKSVERERAMRLEQLQLRDQTQQQQHVQEKGKGKASKGMGMGMGKWWKRVLPAAKLAGHIGGGKGKGKGKGKERAKEEEETVPTVVVGGGGGTWEDALPRATVFRGVGEDGRWMP